MWDPIDKLFSPQFIVQNGVKYSKGLIYHLAALNNDMTGGYAREWVPTLADLTSDQIYDLVHLPASQIFDQQHMALHGPHGEHYLETVLEYCRRAFAQAKAIQDKEKRIMANQDAITRAQEIARNLEQVAHQEPQYGPDTLHVAKARKPSSARGRGPTPVEEVETVRQERSFSAMPLQGPGGNEPQRTAAAFNGPRPSLRGGEHTSGSAQLAPVLPVPHRVYDPAPFHQQQGHREAPLPAKPNRFTINRQQQPAYTTGGMPLPSPTMRAPVPYNAMMMGGSMPGMSGNIMQPQAMYYDGQSNPQGMRTLHSGHHGFMPDPSDHRQVSYNSPMQDYLARSQMQYSEQVQNQRGGGAVGSRGRGRGNMNNGRKGSFNRGGYGGNMGRHTSMNVPPTEPIPPRPHQDSFERFPDFQPIEARPKTEREMCTKKHIGPDVEDMTTLWFGNLARGGSPEALQALIQTKVVVSNVKPFSHGGPKGDHEFGWAFVE